MNSYKELIAWQKSIELVKLVYKITDNLPNSELYVLTSQMRRAAISIPSNIAEGYRRRGTREYIQFLSIADASAAELETQLIIAKELYRDVDYLEAEGLIIEIQKMLSTLIRKLSSRS